MKKLITSGFYVIVLISLPLLQGCQSYTYSGDGGWRPVRPGWGYVPGRYWGGGGGWRHGGGGYGYGGGWGHGGHHWGRGGYLEESSTFEDPSSGDSQRDLAMDDLHLSGEFGPAR